MATAAVTACLDGIESGDGSSDDSRDGGRMMAATGAAITAETVAE